MNNKTAMLIFNHYRTPKDAGGLRSWHIGKKLKQMGYSVTAIVPGVDTLSGVKRGKLDGRRLWAKEIIDGVKILWVNSTQNVRTVKWKRAMYYLSYSCLQLILALRSEKPKVVITMSLPVSSILVGFFIARLRGAKFVIDARDVPTEMAMELGYIRSSFFLNLLLSLEAFLFRKAEMVIAVSQGIGKIIEQKGVDSQKIKIIPIGYDGYQFDGMLQPEMDIRSKHSLSDSFIVLYAGTMGYVIDIPTVISAARITKKYKKIVYLFVGDGQKLQAYKEMAKQEALNCIFIGRRPKHEIPSYCRQADLAVYPLADGIVIGTLLGNKIYDYLGAGVPVAYVGPEGDAKRLIEKAKAGICFKPKDGKGLAKGIIELFSNRKKLIGFGANACQYIEENYRVERVMDTFGQTIDSILE